MVFEHPKKVFDCVHNNLHMPLGFPDHHHEPGLRTMTIAAEVQSLSSELAI